MQEKIPFNLIQQCDKALLDVRKDNSIAFQLYGTIIPAYDAIEKLFLKLEEEIEYEDALINKKDAEEYCKMAKELINLIIPISADSEEKELLSALNALEQAISTNSNEEKSYAATLEPAEILQATFSTFPGVYRGQSALEPLSEKIEKQELLTLETQEKKTKACSNFFKFWQENSNVTSRLPLILLPIPVSIGLTYLASLAYDASCATTSIDSVNNFFNSKLRDASSVADGLKTPGVIYGLATMLVVAVWVRAYWHSKKQKSAGVAAIPREDNSRNNSI